MKLLELMMSFTIESEDEIYIDVINVKRRSYKSSVIRQTYYLNRVKIKLLMNLIY